jgi:hypothetical protein
MKLYTYSTARQRRARSSRKHLAKEKYRSDVRTVACTP